MMEMRDNGESLGVQHCSTGNTTRARVEGCCWTLLHRQLFDTSRTGAVAASPLPRRECRGTSQSAEVMCAVQPANRFPTKYSPQYSSMFLSHDSPPHVSWGLLRPSTTSKPICQIISSSTQGIFVKTARHACDVTSPNTLERRGLWYYILGFICDLTKGGHFDAPLVQQANTNCPSPSACFNNGINITNVHYIQDDSKATAASEFC